MKFFVLSALFVALSTPAWATTPLSTRSVKSVYQRELRGRAQVQSSTIRPQGEASAYWGYLSRPSMQDEGRPGVYALKGRGKVAKSTYFIAHYGVFGSEIGVFDRLTHKRVATGYGMGIGLPAIIKWSK